MVLVWCLVPRILGGRILFLPADNPESTPPPCGPGGAPLVIEFWRFAAGGTGSIVTRTALGASKDEKPCIGFFGFNLTRRWSRLPRTRLD